MIDLQTYSDQIIQHIKNLLLQGQLLPGDKINEVHLAAALSISRAPIREALQTLVSEGLVIAIPQRGKFIKKLTSKEIEDNYFIGGILEGASVALSAPSLVAKDFVALETIIEKMHAISPDANFPTELARLDVLFHENLLGQTYNKQILKHSRNICQRMSKFLLFNHWPTQFTQEEIVTRHQKILDVLKTKEPYAIEMIIREHYKELSDRMARFGEKEPL